jgi:hypothetical protein
LGDSFPLEFFISLKLGAARLRYTFHDKGYISYIEELDSPTHLSTHFLVYFAHHNTTTTMPFRDILKKKEKDEVKEAPVQVDEQPVFTFMRSDTHTQEIISPPTFSSLESASSNPHSFTDGNSESKTSRLFKGRSRSNSNASTASAASRASDGRRTRPATSKRLSERLHLRKAEASESVPEDLPEIVVPDGEEEIGTGVESQWERRATMLARKNEQSRSRPGTPSVPAVDLTTFNNMTVSGSPGGSDTGVVLTKATDDNIQEAIKLHEAGELEKSTGMFGRLADPNGQNNALSQVLYGLALRYVNWPPSCNLYHSNRPQRAKVSFHSCLDILRGMISDTSL